ncbi:hypothetical protein DYB37_002219 [Aphanomyces astaci]|uniref:Uncharacterized protein n=1 Tax=Aphanomyces astaci TaxID=112090 RepID=A0A397EGS0_APHAT|nr:hypothetical protein DYB36_000391 [Aphanomyces astaci]RHY25497.1 hypothetical protein DYB25_001937 [Aphanomyces astaci]RHY47164.1 hypothetical protein DYB30_007706 [Aphanomyces astaci]RHY53367.1 hypothetical protein DYB38_004822 [Aphanomyces astaci]RHY66145.1 hypothetical protein DYB34_002260 [Aphanomyces astaci]
MHVGGAIARVLLKDPENIPLVAMVTLGLVMGTATCVRYLVASPDVRISKRSRENCLYYLTDKEKEAAEKFQKYRHALANLSANPINRDPSFQAHHARGSGA